MKTMRRPVAYSAALAARICERIAEGEGLRAICADETMPARRTVLRWLADERRADFRARYALAREAQADFYDEEIHLVAMEATPATAAVAKLRIDAMKWRLSRLAPRKYGDRAEDGDHPAAIAAIERIIIDPKERE